MRFNSYLLSTTRDDYCQVKLAYNDKSLKIHTFHADKGICIRPRPRKLLLPV